MNPMRLARRRWVLVAVVMMAIACGLQAAEHAAPADGRSSGMYSNDVDPGTADFDADLRDLRAMEMERLREARDSYVASVSSEPMEATH